MSAENTIHDQTDFLFNQLGANAEEQYVTFRLDLEEYGIPILRVQEIVSLPEVTRIPNTPASIKGLINLRGNIIPLVDLRVKFGLAIRETDHTTVVIVVQVGSKVFGMIVDKVSDVLSFGESHLQAAPDFTAGIEAHFIDKMGKIGDRLVILLDIEKVLAPDELKHIEQMVK